MEHINQPSNQNTPFMKRTINGQEFTVVIHFKKECRESIQEKVKRMLRFDVQNAEISV